MCVGKRAQSRHPRLSFPSWDVWRKPEPLDDSSIPCGSDNTHSGHVPVPGEPTVSDTGEWQRRVPVPGAALGVGGLETDVQNAPPPDVVRLQPPTPRAREPGVHSARMGKCAGTSYTLVVVRTEIMSLMVANN